MPDQLFVDCAFRFGYEECISVKQPGFTVLKRCEVTDSWSDGLDARTSRIVLEDECTMGYTGLQAGRPRTADQASTGHDACRMIRIGSEYKFTGGACVQDVNTTIYEKNDCYSVAAGCFFHSSFGTTTPAARRLAIYLGGSNSADQSEVWLIEPRFTDRFGTSTPWITKRLRLDDRTRCHVDRVWNLSDVVRATSATLLPINTVTLTFPAVPLGFAPETAGGDALSQP
jgi:hypothetical protein